MKTTKRLIIHLCIFFCFNNSITYAQAVLSCDGTVSPGTVAGSVASVSCAGTSASWSNIYKKVATYRPNTNSPTKVIGINFIIFQDALGGNNFQKNNAIHNQRLDNIFGYLRSVYFSNNPASDPIAGVVDLPQKFIDFELKGIYYYRSSQYNTSNDGDGMINYLRLNDPLRLNYLNIFLTNGNGYAHASRGDDFSQTSDLFISLRGIYGDGLSTVSDYASSILMGHEMGHVLDLCHTYICPSCGCYSSLSFMRTNPEDGDYFDDIFGTTYPGNAPHYKPGDPPINPSWSYDVTLSTTDKITNNLLGGFQASQNLSPLQIGKAHRALALKSARRYLINCVYDSNNPWTISGNEDWDFDIQWDKDINIQSGATVNLSCKLSMPQSSSITVESGGVLNIDGIVTNNCENGWNGTIHVKPGGILNLKANADITFKGNGKILIDDDVTNPGKLTIEGNPKVYLDDNNTTIDIRGKLELKNNSTFSFNYHNNSNTTYGYIKFANTSILPSRNITAGSNCDINFTGNSQNKKILQINQETFYAPPNIVNFTISAGKVELAANARIQADDLNTIIDFHSAKFTSTTGGNNGHRGVHLYGQPNVTINNCIFENGNSGIFAFLTYGGAPLTIINSSFSNNLIGVDANDKGCSLRGCNFNNNATGYKGSNMIFNSSCLESYFNYNTSVGAFWQSSNSSVFTTDNSHFDYNEVGLWANNGPLHVQCGSINYNNFGLKIENGSTLIMDAASAVTAVGNNYTIKPLAATYLNINNGYNDLTPALVNNQRAINGTMLPGGAYPLQAAFNKWNNSNSFADTDYLLSDINGNPLTINGSNPQSVVATCGYVLPEPCKRAPCPPEVGIEALVLCPDCDVINTAGFVNKKLNEATSTTLELLNSKKFNKYRTAIKLFYQILNSNYLNPDDKESYLLQLNYQKLKETLGNAFLANQISKTENQVKLCAEVQNVIDIEDKLIGKAIQDKDFKRKFLFNMDKVQSLRVASRRDLSLNVLNKMLSWVEGDERDEVNNLICVINIEIAGLEKRIDLGTVQALINECNSKGSHRLAASKEAIPTILIGNEATISIFPNPVNNIANISTNIENARLEIYDGIGRSIINSKMNFNLDINLSAYPKGFYTIKIEDIKTSKVYIRKIILQ